MSKVKTLLENISDKIKVTTLWESATKYDSGVITIADWAEYELFVLHYKTNTEWKTSIVSKTELENSSRHVTSMFGFSGSSVSLYTNGIFKRKNSTQFEFSAEYNNANWVLGLYKVEGIKLLGGGYYVVSLLCVISSLVRRWSHEQEIERSANETRDRKSHQILWDRYCMGLVFFIRNMGIHLPVWNHFLGNADSDLLKGRERNVAIEHHGSVEEHNTSIGELFDYGKHKECRLDRNRENIAVALGRGCC